MRLVVKVGTSSITNDHGELDEASVAALVRQVARARSEGHEVLVVTSAAIAAGLPALGLSAQQRPRDLITLQAVSAVGQTHLMELYQRCFAEADGSVCGQVLLAPHDFMIRSQYLHAKATLQRLLELSVVPVINENDAIADDEIRFGDNDRIAALVAQLVDAELLVLLTDADGLLSADPRTDDSATLIEEIDEITSALESLAGGSGTNRGSGGMATKIAAAKMAAWSGVRTVIAAAHRDGVVMDAIAQRRGVGTIVHPRVSPMPARKLWIAFAVTSHGTVTVDDGAQEALRRSSSLLAVGITGFEGEFDAGDPVDIVDERGVAFAKGISRVPSTELVTGETNQVIVHRDDLVILP